MNDNNRSLIELCKEIVGDTVKVYFQPPDNTKMQYPCVVISMSNIPEKKADNIKYIRHYEYTLTLIHPNGNNDIVDKLMDLKYCTFSSSFKTQGLYHYVFKLNYKI